MHDKWGGGETLGGDEGGETIIKIYCMKRFSIKKGQKQEHIKQANKQKGSLRK